MVQIIKMMSVGMVFAEELGRLLVGLIPINKVFFLLSLSFLRFSDSLLLLVTDSLLLSKYSLPLSLFFSYYS